MGYDSLYIKFVLFRSGSLIGWGLRQNEILSPIGGESIEIDEILCSLGERARGRGVGKGKPGLDS